jgi:hypothetical protein
MPQLSSTALRMHAEDLRRMVEAHGNQYHKPAGYFTASFDCSDSALYRVAACMAGDWLILSPGCPVCLEMRQARNQPPL